MKKLLNFLILTPMVTLLFSCAGPADPFGAKDVKSVFQDEIEKTRNDNKEVIRHYEESMNTALTLREPASAEEELLVKDNEFATIEFTPGRQNFHEAFDFQIHVRDELGISQSHKLKIYYNDLEISEAQYNNFNKKIHDDGKGYTLTHKNFRLPVKELHHIKALFWRNEEAPPIVETFDEPFCDVKGETRKIASMGEFSRHYPTFQLIRSVSNYKEINPNFIAAIVAKESSFNPKAVSWAKAIGLTQVTPIAAKEIKRSKKINWKVYPGTEKMSYFRLKTAVSTGIINKNNDWRLDKKKSIKGAIAYLEYLEKYWQKAQRSHDIQLDSDLETDLILASYNSGAARVKNAYLKDNENWYNRKDLKEAKKYFRKIKSYCYSFEHPEG